MTRTFGLTPLAREDLDSIWWFIARDNPEAADRVEREILATCARLEEAGSDEPPGPL